MVGIWSKFGQGRKFVKKIKIWKVLRMGLPIVENLSGLCGNIFSLFKRPQLHFCKKIQNVSSLIHLLEGYSISNYNENNYFGILLKIIKFPNQP